MTSPQLTAVPLAIFAIAGTAARHRAMPAPMPVQLANPVPRVSRPNKSPPRPSPEPDRPRRLRPINPARMLARAFTASPPTTLSP
jgi:hypothetical protein